MTRHRHGHGSLSRGEAIVLPHVGYWIVEHRDASICEISGHVRGDAKILESMHNLGQPLVLLLDNGARLRILLTEKHADDAQTWDFTSSALGLS